MLFSAVIGRSGVFAVNRSVESGVSGVAPPSGMTQSNGETRLQRSRVQQLRDGFTERSQRARNTVQNITTDDVRGFFRRNAFVIFTVAAVIIGEMMFDVETTVCAYYSEREKHTQM